MVLYGPDRAVSDVRVYGEESTIAAKEGQVTEGMASIRERIENLAHVVGRLEDALRPVLREAQPDVEREPKPQERAYRSPLADNLNDMSRELSALADRLHSVLNHLDL